MSTELSSEQVEASDADGPSVADLEAQLELVEEENRRLREAYGHVRQTRYQRTALGLAAVGTIAIAGALLFTSARVVLVILGATGYFSALLTWYLTPERFVAADVGERVYEALASNEGSISAELGLNEPGRYIPLPEQTEREAVLYLGQTSGRELPTPEELTETFVVVDDDRRGVAFKPTGEPLLAELRQATPGGLADDVVTLADQLTDGLREQFELVDGAQPDIETDAGRLSVNVSGSAFGAVDRFDHPVASLLGTGLAVGLNHPIEVTVDHVPEHEADYLLTARWEVDASQADSPADEASR